MRKKILLSTIVSFVLLAAVIAAGINAVFTVSDVQTEYVVYSAEGRAETAQLNEKLGRYRGKSSTFLDLNDVKDTVEQFPCLSAERIEKKYPSAVSLTVRERKETYAVRQENGFAVFDEEGRYLYEKADNVNRLDGDKNILLEGFSFVCKERTAAEGEYAAELFAAFDTLKETLGSIRANVLRAELKKFSSDGRTHFFYIYMREGVMLSIKNPAKAGEEKAAVAVEKYLSLTDKQRVKGVIDVVDDLITGTGVNVSYSDEFVPMA